MKRINLIYLVFVVWLLSVTGSNSSFAVVKLCYYAGGKFSGHTHVGENKKALVKFYEKIHGTPFFLQEKSEDMGGVKQKSVEEETIALENAALSSTIRIREVVCLNLLAREVELKDSACWVGSLPVFTVFEQNQSAQNELAENLKVVSAVSGQPGCVDQREDEVAKNIMQFLESFIGKEVEKNDQGKEESDETKEARETIRFIRVNLPTLKAMKKQPQEEVNVELGEPGGKQKRDPSEGERFDYDKLFMLVTEPGKIEKLADKKSELIYIDEVCYVAAFDNSKDSGVIDVIDGIDGIDGMNGKAKTRKEKEDVEKKESVSFDVDIFLSDIGIIDDENDEGEVPPMSYQPQLVGFSIGYLESSLMTAKASKENVCIRVVSIDGNISKLLAMDRELLVKDYSGEALELDEYSEKVRLSFLIKMVEDKPENIVGLAITNIPFDKINNSVFEGHLHKPFMGEYFFYDSQLIKPQITFTSTPEGIARTFWQDRLEKPATTE